MKNINPDVGLFSFKKFFLVLGSLISFLSISSMVYVYVTGLRTELYSIELSDILIEYSVSVQLIIFLFLVANSAFLVFGVLELRGYEIVYRVPWYVRYVGTLFLAPFSGISMFLLVVRLAAMESLFLDHVPLTPLIWIKRNWGLDERMEYVRAYFTTIGVDVEQVQEAVKYVDPDFVRSLAGCGTSISEVGYACNGYILELKRLQEVNISVPWYSKFQTKVINIFSNADSTGIWDYVVAHPYWALGAAAFLGLVLYRSFSSTVAVGSQVLTSDQKLAILARAAEKHEAQLQSIVEDIAQLKGGALPRATIGALHNLSVILASNPEVLDQLAALARPHHMAGLAAARRAVELAANSASGTR
jgi:hypothetical protein